MYVDTHAHLNFSAFRDDADDVIKKSLEEGVWMIMPGSDYKSSKRSLSYANKYERGVYTAVGLHPIHTVKMEYEEKGKKRIIEEEEFNYGLYEELAQHEKTVAVGEIGLDYFHINKDVDIEAQKKKQKEIFVRQLELADNLRLPVIIHCRDAHEDMLAILKKFKEERGLSQGQPWGVMHCFSGDEDLAWKYFSFGLLVSFTGLITFNSGWDDLIRKLPFDKFMIETDAPYMTPSPWRGRRNEPIFVKEVAKKIAKIKGADISEVENHTTNNAKKFFKI